MIFAIFVLSLAAAVAIGGYTFGVLFGSWARPAKGPFVPPPLPAQPVQAFVPFIPPIEPAPAPRPLPGVTEVEHATPLSSVFVSLPTQAPPPVPTPMIARGTNGNPALANGRPTPRIIPRAAKGSVPPPLPARPLLRNARPIQPEDFLDNEATNVDTIPTPHR